ncbi:glycosyltransferase [Demequina muriae]|uniref:Glycosyltransferase n=1 Tax=Demequina muriae TaxID=3051664 RepID=A0ABT8GG62_9MICO|nr:glycosyltransferase [Demequina sp. EGI L300058]MDN4480428.1 glycosyltransferase [Demequina sp. EGI L300058]
MSSPADVSIIIPVHNDEGWISTALESCLRQTLDTIEVICVDDASTDSTREVIEGFQSRDPRVRLIRMESNVSALQCRRVGVESAQADHILFLDGDDELAPDAAKRAVAKARAANADLVGFGVEVLNPDGRTVGGYQSRLRHAHASLEGDAVLPGLFPVGKPAQGQLWRYLFATSLLRDAYRMLPAELVLRRVNDLPVMFLVAALAKRYVSMEDHLYKYYFRRGGSGHPVEELSQFEFYLSAIDSIDSIAPAVSELAASSADAAQLHASYDSARLALIANVLGYLQSNVNPALRTESLALLHDRVSPHDVVTAAVTFGKDALEVLAEHGTRLVLGERPVRSVLLVTATLTTGGVSAVLLSQARYLIEAGCQVTIAARRAGSDLDGLPDGARFVEVGGDGLAERVETWAEVCRRDAIDVIIDHQILYSRDWPAYALMARALGVPTIGWIHNFALRPVYDQGTLSTFLTTHLNALATLVTLSPLDVAFWKLRGIAHTAYLPNPPSPMLLESSGITEPKPAPQGRLELVWVGRLDQHTKQVRQLVDVAAELQRLSVDFHLSIIGPEWAGFTEADLAAEVDGRGLSGSVTVVGPLRGEALIAAIDTADVFVTTSIIEGYQLTLAEAQARGLPVAMYELPWLTLVQDNHGLIVAPQSDATALARQIAVLVDDPDRYQRLSAASIEAAERARSYDFRDLYQRVIAGTLPPEYSPEPTLDDAKQLIDWTIFYAERHAPGSRARRRAGRARDTSLAGRAKRRLATGARGVVRTVPRLEPLARRLRSRFTT